MVSPALEIMGMEMPRLAKRAAREARHQPDGPHRRHREALRPEGDPSAAAAARAGRHPHALLHAPIRAACSTATASWCPRRARARRSRRVVRHRARPHELQLRRRAAAASSRDCCPTASAPISPCPGRLNTVHSMTEIMTRFLGLGFTLPQVVTMSHVEPGQGHRRPGAARQPGRGTPGRHLGAESRATATGWSTTSWESGLRVNRAFIPYLTVKRGRVFTPDFGPRPWGWLPDRAVGGGCC